MRSVLRVCIVFVGAAFSAAPQMAQLAYLGGSGTDDCDGIALDGAGNIYLACHSDSPDFPPVDAAAQSRGDMDAVVVKIEARTGRLIWATRSGGSAWDAAGELRLSPEGSIYVLGSTRSTDFPTTADAVQRAFGGPDRDGFLLKLDSTGKIVYSTLLGGSKNDEPTSMSVAPNGTVFIGGVTMSADFPGSRAARFGDGGQADGFIAQFQPGDPNSLRTILLGGKSRDSVTGLERDQSGNLFAAGYTASDDFPVKNAVQPHFGGGIDAFLVKLRSSDWNLLFSSFVGGSKMDGAYDVSLDSAADPIIAGVTESTDFPHTDSVFQPRLRGSVDAFVTKISGDGGRLLWSTYYGGSKANSDQFLGGSLATDDAGTVWFTGMTNSPDLPIHTPSQPVYGGGDFDGFLGALSSDGSKLCYASFFGGNGHDILEGLATRDGKVYVSGVTSSANLEQKNAEVQRRYGGGPFDAFIVALDMAHERTCR